MTTTDFLVLLPLLILAGWACLLLLIDLLVPAGRKGWTAALAMAGLVAVGVVTGTQWNWSLPAFGGMIVVDGYSLFLNYVFLLSGAAGIVLAQATLARQGI